MNLGNFTEENVIDYDELTKSSNGKLLLRKYTYRADGSKENLEKENLLEVGAVIFLNLVSLYTLFRNLSII